MSNPIPPGIQGYDRILGSGWKFKLDKDSHGSTKHAPHINGNCGGAPCVMATGNGHKGNSRRRVWGNEGWHHDVRNTTGYGNQLLVSSPVNYLLLTVHIEYPEKNIYGPGARVCGHQHKGWSKSTSWGQATGVCSVCTTYELHLPNIGHWDVWVYNSWLLYYEVRILPCWEILKEVPMEIMAEEGTYTVIGIRWTASHTQLL